MLEALVPQAVWEAPALLNGLGPEDFVGRPILDDISGNGGHFTESSHSRIILILDGSASNTKRFVSAVLSPNLLVYCAIGLSWPGAGISNVLA